MLSIANWRDPNVSDSIINGIANIGPSGVGHLIGILEQDEPEVPTVLVGKALAKIRDPRSIDRLQKRLKKVMQQPPGGRPPHVPIADALEPFWTELSDESRALCAIAKSDWRKFALVGPIGIPLLFNEITPQTGYDICKWLSFPLIDIGGPGLPHLVAALKDERPQVRTTVAMAIERLGDDRATAELMAAFDREDEPTIRRLIADAIVSCGAALTPEQQLKYALISGRWVKAAEVGTVAVGKLLDIAANAPGNVFHAIAAALAQAKPPAIEPLIDALRDGRSFVRSTAAEALDKIGDVRAVAPLFAMIEHEGDDYARCVAQAALQRFAATMDNEQRKTAEDLGIIGQVPVDSAAGLPTDQVRCRACGNVQERDAYQKALDVRARAKGAERMLNLSQEIQCVKCGSFDIVDPRRAQSVTSAEDRFVRLMANRIAQSGTDRVALRAIGEELNRIGGHKLMLAAFRHAPNSGRWLEEVWDRIGDWQS